MQVRRFDIFSGAFDRDPMWIETVEGLDSACDRMREHAAQNHGKFFVFCMETHKVVDSIDTTEPKRKLDRPSRVFER